MSVVPRPTRSVPNDATAALTVEQTALVAGLSRTTIFKLIASGEIVARKIGRRTVVLRSDLMRFLDDLPRRGQ